ncbi:hypothetical protein L596_028545 [Steinernema carpocapsae]|uniref:Secreted protein n=1 Tax=Steinernema carpocapsae TaxID=34508 RepID=A0A4U5LYT5_STECR|nr:hypothetical protein L596_028545 [Steinernema carpocapsae]
MFAIRYLLLFCFFTALCTNAAKNANERACEMPSLAKTPGLQRSTQTLFTRLANWRAEPVGRAGSASGSGEPAHEPACSARLANPARHPSLIETHGGGGLACGVDVAKVGEKALHSGVSFFETSSK